MLCDGPHSEKRSCSAAPLLMTTAVTTMTASIATTTITTTTKKTHLPSFLQWSPWSPCIDGVQYQFRSCHGSTLCNGPHAETRLCTTTTITTTVPTTIVLTKSGNDIDRGNEYTHITGPCIRTGFMWMVHPEDTILEKVNSPNCATDPDRNPLWICTSEEINWQSCWSTCQHEPDCHFWTYADFPVAPGVHNLKKYICSLHRNITGIKEHGYCVTGPQYCIPNEHSWVVPIEEGTGNTMERICAWVCNEPGATSATSVRAQFRNIKEESKTCSTGVLGKAEEWKGGSSLCFSATSENFGTCSQFEFAEFIEFELYAGPNGQIKLCQLEVFFKSDEKQFFYSTHEGEVFNTSSREMVPFKLRFHDQDDDGYMELVKYDPTS
jgi:hypothetical protein